MCPRDGGVNGRAVFRVPGAEIVGGIHLCRPKDVSGWPEVLRQLAWGLVSGAFQYLPSERPIGVSLEITGLEITDSLPAYAPIDVANDPMVVYASAWDWKIRKPRKRREA